MPKREPGKALAKTGRPSIYTRSIGDEICCGIAGGEPLRRICEDAHLPHRTAVLEWVVQNRDGFGDRYARARIDGLHAMAEQAIQIADETPKNDDQVRVARDRLRIETRKWFTGKLLPSVYGERASVRITRESGGDASTALDLTAATDEELLTLQRVLGGVLTIEHEPPSEVEPSR